MTGCRTEIEIQTGRITGGTNHPGGIVGNAAVMEKHQQPGIQIGLAAMGIHQVTGEQIQSHGVDREIPPHQIRLQGSGRHDRVHAGLWIGLRPCRGQIQGFSVETKRHGAETVVFDAVADPLWSSPSQQGGCQHGRVTLHHQVQVSEARPGPPMALMQESIAHGSTHQSQSLDALLQCC